MIVVFIILLAIQAFAEEIPETVEERLSLEFHSVSGGETVTLNLVEYFGSTGPFVVSPTVHVDVEISPTGIATIFPKDPNWQGIEEVIFAISEEFLKKEEKEKYIPRLRSLSEITSKDKIALDSDAFTQEQYEAIVGKLTPKQITIASTVSEDSVTVDLNNEVLLGFSVKADSKSAVPSIGMDFHANDEEISLGSYKEPDNRLFLGLVVIGIGTIMMLGFYLHYMVTGPMRSAFTKPKKAAVRVSKAGAYKGNALASLKKIKQGLAAENPAKAYKGTLSLMNSFLSKSFKLQGSPEQMAKTLNSYGVDSGVKSDILSYMTEYREAAYKAAAMTKNEAEKLISFVESILKRL